VLAAVLLIEAAYAVRCYAGVRRADPVWRARFQAGILERRRRRNRLVWASVAVLVVGLLTVRLAGGRADLDPLVLGGAYLLFAIAVTTAWTITGLEEHRWHRREGAPRSFLALQAASTIAFPIGILAYVALRLW
jgi:hypothetical protein